MVPLTQDKASSDSYLKLSILDFEVFGSTQHNESLGLARRLLRDVPERFVVDDFIEAGNYIFFNLVKQLQKLTPDQLLSHYSGGKKKKYQKAYADLLDFPLTPKHFYATSFVKKARVSDVSEYPRMVHFRKYGAIFELLRYVKPIEACLYKQKLRVNQLISVGRCVAKGRNGSQRAKDIEKKWDAFKDPECLSLDCSSFELHVSKDYLEMENLLLRAFYKRDKYLKWMLKNMLYNTGFTMCNMKWSRTGGRISGDAHTGLGNTLAMLVCVIGLSFRYPMIKMDCYSDGDDTLLFLERGSLDYQLIVEHFAAFGHELRLDGVAHVIEDIVFCKHHLLDGFYIRNPLEIVQKSLVILNSSVTSVEKLIEHLGALGKGIMASYGCIPELRRFINVMISFDKNAEPSSEFWLNYLRQEGSLAVGRIYDVYDFDSSALESIVDILVYLSTHRSAMTIN